MTAVGDLAGSESAALHYPIDVDLINRFGRTEASNISIFGLAGCGVNSVSWDRPTRLRNLANDLGD